MKCEGCEHACGVCDKGEYEIKSQPPAEQSDKPEKIWIRKSPMAKANESFDYDVYSAGTKPIFPGETEYLRADLAKPSEWISVETELPEDSRTVIVFNGGIGSGHFHRWGRDEHGRIIGMEDSNHEDGWEWSGEGFEVEPPATHWQYLPSPPDKETK